VKQKEQRLTAMDYAAIAAFRLELRRFLLFSEAAAAKVGLPPQQHQALLAIAGHPGPGQPSVGTIAKQLLVAPHTAAELVSRMVQAGLVTKAASPEDRRRIELRLTPNAERILRQLTSAHFHELENLEPALARALRRPGRQPTSPQSTARSRGTR
jgi:DNA-binding MarR family transcriptional regulator